MIKLLPNEVCPHSVCCVFKTDCFGVKEGRNNIFICEFWDSPQISGHYNKNFFIKKEKQVENINK